MGERKRGTKEQERSSLRGRRCRGRNVVENARNENGSNNRFMEVQEEGCISDLEGRKYI